MMRAQLLIGFVLAASSAAGAARADTLQLRASLGVGVHGRAIERPMLTLPAAYVPAVEAGLGVVVWPDTEFSLAASLHYQTGLWLTVRELPPFALASETSVRSQRLALNIAPSWRIASSRIGFALGATLRSFWPEDHSLQMPSYNLLGPHVRGELLMALLGPVRLRVSPELHWVFAIDKTAAAARGAAIGGELALELAWGPMRTLALCYRESHALFSRGGSSRDVERYLTLRIEEAF